jgi:hypothetical protein
MDAVGFLVSGGRLECVDLRAQVGGFLAGGVVFGAQF